MIFLAGGRGLRCSFTAAKHSPPAGPNSNGSLKPMSSQESQWKIALYWAFCQYLCSRVRLCSVRV
jgi:hypothetical protein